MKKNRTFFITISATIAALYVVLTLISSAFGLDKGIFQFRLSEILTVLPVFTPAAIPGLFIGCLLANILSAALPIDIIFGGMATLIGAIGTFILGKKSRYLAGIPPILTNALILPFILKYTYHLDGSVPFFIFTIAISEFLTAGICGAFLINYLSKRRFYKNHINNKNHN